MTYNLEEFNTWYNRQGNNWPSHNWNVACYQRPDWTETFLTSHRDDDYGTRLRAWMALVDEREREREREPGGDPNMLRIVPVKYLTASSELLDKLREIQRTHTGIYEINSSAVLNVLIKEPATRTQMDQAMFYQNWRSVKRMLEPLATEMELEGEIAKLKAELATERTTTQEALRTGQEWHERQKAEIIAEWKAKYTNLLNSRQEKVRQEINLIKEVLND